MITLECNYQKKLGLPGYSSHQFAITLRTEIADLTQVQAESARLYKLLQEGVDTSIKETGYLPTNGNGNGQRRGQNGNGKPNMHEYIIEAMVKALKPLLKNPAKAKQILDRFWSDKIALVWNVQDVHTAANEREVALTSKEAMKVLQKMHHYHDKQLGLRWKDVTCYIEEYALGRKLTKAELKRFIEKNVVSIERKDRKRQ